jgi:hypothetical protein
LIKYIDIFSLIWYNIVTKQNHTKEKGEKSMRKLYNQLSLSDIFDHCKGLFENDKSKFITLLENSIDFDDFIPKSFHNAFYQNFGRKRDYSLSAFISAFILQKILSIPTDSLLIIFLKNSKEIRDFCGFYKVPDASKFTRFKQDFLEHLTILFNHLVDLLG